MVNPCQDPERDKLCGGGGSLCRSLDRVRSSRYADKLEMNSKKRGQV